MRLNGIGLTLVLLVLFAGTHCTQTGPGGKKDNDAPDPANGNGEAPSNSVVASLELIGRHLMTLESEGNLEYYHGAAFLLQVKDRLTSGELDVFINPADRNPPGGPRPAAGSAAFAAMYANLRLPGGVLPRECSFAGPNWTDFPEQPGDGRRLWASDACWNGKAPQNGVYVLWSDGTAELLSLRDIEGASRATRTVHVGPHSPDPRLRTMCFEELR